MKPAVSAAETRYTTVVQAFSSRPGVAIGAGRKKGFGASALAADGRIFAMLSSRGHFVVKLPQARVDALVAGSLGARFDPGHGRLMKEWLEIADPRRGDWIALAAEAHAHVGRRP